MTRCISTLKTIATGSITTANIADGAVTYDKLNDDAKSYIYFVGG